MLILGHAGITLGAAILLDTVVARGYSIKTRQNGAKNYPAAGNASWLISLRNYVDIRLLLLASLFPDIIDKPLGLVFLKDTFNNGRIYCHTLAFTLLITLAGFYICRRHGKTWLLTLAFGSFTHLLFDKMWLEPQTLFWPLYGFTFHRGVPNSWISDNLVQLRLDPGTYFPEIAGAVILVGLVVVLIRRKAIGAFIRSGKLSNS